MIDDKNKKNIDELLGEFSEVVSEEEMKSLLKRKNWKYASVKNDVFASSILWEIGCDLLAQNRPVRHLKEIGKKNYEFI